jgi:hypothetical protein
MKDAGPKRQLRIWPASLGCEAVCGLGDMEMARSNRSVSNPEVVNPPPENESCLCFMLGYTRQGSAQINTAFTPMEIFGMFGFMFGMIAFAMAGSLKSDVQKLKEEVDELKQKLPQI